MEILIGIGARLIDELNRCVDISNHIPDYWSRRMCQYERRASEMVGLWRPGVNIISEKLVIREIRNHIQVTILAFQAGLG